MMRRILLKLFRRRRLQDELEAEIAFHREMAAAAGNPIPFGNSGVIKEQAFDLWRFNRVENLWRDLALAVRSLRHSRGFVLSALLSLGLGIGVNTAIFSLAVEFLLSQPSVRDAASLVYVQQGGNSHMEPPTIDQLRRSGVFEDVAGENEESFINFNDGIDTRRIFAMQATKNYFSALGVPVATGRGWNESDADEVVVLHPRFWRSRLGGDPAIVGKTIRLDGRPYMVLGILPDNYRSLLGYGYAPDVFVPRYLKDTFLAAYARLKPGMTLGQINAAMPALGQRLDQERPAPDDLNKHLQAKPVAGFARIAKERDVLTVALFFVILLTLVGLVLLIACINVAGLSLVRASTKQLEMAIRWALGASRGRLLQQLLSESLLLSFGGAALGFALALIAAKLAAAIPLPFPVPIHLHIEPDWRVASYALLLAVVATVASGLIPAWQSLRESLSSGMHRERKLRMRRVLVVGQIAASFVVLTTAALFLQNLARSSSMGPGFDTRHTVRAEVYLPPNVYKDGRGIDLYARRGVEALRAVPGIESAAAASIVPFTDSSTFEFDLTFPDFGGKQRVRFNWNAVSPDFFRAMDIPVLQGRAFSEQDNGASKVAIVNDVFVKRYLGNHQPLGATFLWWRTGVPYRIVGVVRGTKNMTMGEDPRAQLYEPLAQIHNDRTRIQFIARAATPVAGQLAAVRQALRNLEPAAGLEVQTMFSAIGFAFLPSQIGAGLMGSIGVLALLLAVIGLYGVLAFSVTRRTREIGIRIAVGASPRHVSQLVLADFARMLAAGIGFGLAIALLVTRPLSQFFVPGLSSTDPVSFGGVILVLALTGVLAALSPVRRALSVHPGNCLRSE
jgi:predicted permease